MSAASLLFALCAPLLPATGPRGPQAEPARDATPVTAPAEARDEARRRALARDPRTLPKPADGRWKDFGAGPLEPGDVPPGMFSARAALQRGDLPLAIAELLALLEAEPGYPPAMHQLGVLYFKLQRYGDTAVALERFLEAAPRRIGDTRVLGHAWYSLGEYAKARAHYERVLAAAPDDVEAKRGLALAVMRQGESARALALLGEVTTSEPDHADAWSWTAQILLDQERTEEARTAALRARELSPFEPRPWFLLGQIEFELGNEAEARAAQRRYDELSRAAQEIRSLESRLEYEPHDLAALEGLVSAHASIGDVPGTRRALARWIAERPAELSFRIRALDLLERLGDESGAMVAAESLAKVGAESADAWRRLERYYARIQDRAGQLEAGERSRRLSAGRE